MQFIEIEFRGRRRGIYANPEQYPLTKDDTVIVQADRGIDLGVVNLTGDPWQEHNEAALRDEKSNGHNARGGKGSKGGGRDDDQSAEEAVAELTAEPVLRLANPDDLQRAADNAELELEARQFFLQEVSRLNLQMKLVEAECQLDRRKLTFYFTADGRVDFRELVKVLAQKFQTRIDLRQIGARDESKRLGGIGICGRELCCATWIREFKPVTTAMMKDQHMILNPQKNTGPCGKLRCCLRYEVDQYRELNKLFPKMETKVKGPRGRGWVKKFSYNWEHVGIVWEDGAKFSYGIEELRQCSNWDPDSPPQLLEFHEDPSLELQRKEEKEGELVARGEPSQGGKVKASVRSTPKKAGSGSGGGGGHSCGCGKKPGEEGGGAKLARLSDQINEAHEAASAGDPVPQPEKKDDDSGGGKSRRGRRGGRGRGRRGKPEGESGGSSSNRGKDSQKNRGEGKSPRGRKKSGDGGDGGSSSGKPKRRGGRGRGRGRRNNGGGSGSSSGGSGSSGGGGPKAGGSSSPGKETKGSADSGKRRSSGPSSKPSSDNTPRQPNSRGRTRKR